DGCRRSRGRLRFRERLRAWLITPEESRQRAFPPDEIPGLPGIVDDRFYLAAVTNDAWVVEQADAVALGEARNPVEIEIMEGRTKVLALDQNGAPAQSGLKAFETQLLEQPIIVADRKAPFG